ncbi:hypothetical protein PHMEG_0007256 [Phytophthora megakarya]|uniref:Uncharacterized protein n=1 Tax=Phytophthora megakarya TaxID=4795 RepID=A0A225WM19_9STRA|nr:hypothetical protein PHMEG_0007256 [Phytophthora megakarya]
MTNPQGILKSPEECNPAPPTGTQGEKNLSVSGHSEYPLQLSTEASGGAEEAPVDPESSETPLSGEDTGVDDREPSAEASESEEDDARESLENKRPPFDATGPPLEARECAGVSDESEAGSDDGGETSGHPSEPPHCQTQWYLLSSTDDASGGKTELTTTRKTLQDEATSRALKTAAPIKTHPKSEGVVVVELPCVEDDAGTAGDAGVVDGDAPVVEVTEELEGAVDALLEREAADAGRPGSVAAARPTSARDREEETVGQIGPVEQAFQSSNVGKRATLTQREGVLKPDRTGSQATLAVLHLNPSLNGCTTRIQQRGPEDVAYAGEVPLVLFRVGHQQRIHASERATSIAQLRSRGVTLNATTLTLRTRGISFGGDGVDLSSHRHDGRLRAVETGGHAKDGVGADAAASCEFKLDI